MLKLPTVDVRTPTNMSELVEALAVPGTRFVAGGTDILPNLKHRLSVPSQLVSLARVQELRRLEQESEAVVIGAAMTLDEVAEHPLVKDHFPSLAQAAGRVASPLIRNMGTIGGNIHLDTRCRYVNQTAFWRSAIGGCLKSEGSVCHVVPGGRNCVAAMSSDCVPVLMSLDAVVHLASPRGTRSVPICDYFVADGINHILREPDEVMTHVAIPMPSVPRRSHYTKWSVRKSIDFPLVSFAMRVDLERDDAQAAITSFRVVVGVLGSKPREVSRLEVEGMTLRDPKVASLVAERMFAQCKPLENVPYEAAYRRQMLRHYGKAAIAAMVSG